MKKYIIIFPFLLSCMLLCGCTDWLDYKPSDKQSEEQQFSSKEGLQESAQKILELRLSIGALRCGLLGIGCGFIMTTAVTFAREKNYLPLLFGVPMFIICGFTHCVADAFYYLCVPLGFMKEHALEILGVYACIVLGNFIGCNLYRLIAGSSSAN